MPEGDAVWRTARRLHGALAGQPLTRSDLCWPSLATADLRGATTLEVVPRGKHLLHRLDTARPQEARQVGGGGIRRVELGKRRSDEKEIFQ